MNSSTASTDVEARWKIGGRFASLPYSGHGPHRLQVHLGATAKPGTLREPSAILPFAAFSRAGWRP